MKSYQYPEIKVGDTEQFSVVITAEKFDFFKKITNDLNPLHVDSTYAKQQGFVDRVTYGMLTASFLSTMAGMYMPGKLSLIHNINLKFAKPVYIGDNLLFTATVAEKNDLFKFIVLKVVCINSNKVKVMLANMQIGVLEDG